MCSFVKNDKEIRSFCTMKTKARISNIKLLKIVYEKKKIMQNRKMQNSSFCMFWIGDI